MGNSRLRGAMLNAEMTPAALAASVEVDIKSVHRWLNEDRVPYPMTRIRVAKALDQLETYLWPSILGAQDAAHVGSVNPDDWPTRSAITPDQWHDLFNHARERIDILTYAGEFLVETLDLADIVIAKAAGGTVVRVLIGDPDCSSVSQQAEELSEPWLPDRCRTLVRALSKAAEVQGIEIRIHGTPLYANHLRFDNAVLINTHAFGAPDSRSPVTRYRSDVRSTQFSFFISAFDRVWKIGQPQHSNVKIRRSD